MKKEELFETLSDIDEKKIKEAREYKGKRGYKIYRWAVASVAAAAVALIAIFSPLFRNPGSGSGDYPGMKTVLVGSNSDVLQRRPWLVDRHYPTLLDYAKSL